MLIIVSLAMYTSYKRNMDTSVLSASQRSSNPHNRFVYQMKILAIFYICCTCTDWILTLSGSAALHNGDLLCYNETIIIVNDNLGALYMLVFTIITYFYAFFMWFTFYQVPKKFGIVSRRSVAAVDMIAGDESCIIYDEENM